MSEREFILNALSSNMIQTAMNFGTSRWEFQRSPLFAVDGAYVYAGGVQSGNAFVKQFGLDGTDGWSSQQGTTGTEADTSIVVTGGNVFVAGTTFGSFPGFTLEGTQDIFVLKLNKTDGSLMAATQFNAPDSQHARDIDTDSTGAELYVTGSSMSGFITQSPGIQWDAFLLSFDTDLNVLRSKQIADTGSNTNEILPSANSMAAFIGRHKKQQQQLFIVEGTEGVSLI